MTPAEGLVCAIIRDDATSRPLSNDDSLEQLVKAAFHHNIHLILFDILKKSPARRVLVRLDEYGIQPLLLKGVPLAYTLYRSPTLCERSSIGLAASEQAVAGFLQTIGDGAMLEPPLRMKALRRASILTHVSRHRSYRCSRR